MTLLEIADSLRAEMRGLAFGSPAAYVYHPLDYAWAPHAKYVTQWGGRGASVLLVGMNPGPFGMAQTGVPFGAIPPVRDWLRCAAPVAVPERTHPQRPVEGFACRRTEVSGARLWGWAEEIFGTPEAFFEVFFVYNYCPLLFLADSGANLVPEKLKAAERASLLPPCDRALRATVQALGIRRVVGVGGWAEERARAALAGLSVDFGRILHPSPASPAANHGWAAQATAQLRALGVDLPKS
jgi:single-strand selective monofunctional uracil DNA glycosylase